MKLKFRSSAHRLEDGLMDGRTDALFLIIGIKRADGETFSTANYDGAGFFRIFIVSTRAKFKVKRSVMHLF